MTRFGALVTIIVGRGMIFALASAVALVALFLIGFALWKGMASEIGNVVKAIPSTLKPIMRAFYGGQDVTELMGFLAGFFQHPIPMMLLSVSAIGSAGRAIAGEVEHGTADLLFARPVTRDAVLAGHAGAAVARLAVICAGFPIGIVVSATVTGQWESVDFDRCLATSANAFALFVCVFGYSLVLSARSRSAGAVYTWSGVLTVVFYLASFLADVNEEWKALKEFTPFGYFRSVAVMKGDHMPWGDVSLLVGAGLVFMGVAWLLLRRRDL